MKRVTQFALAAPCILLFAVLLVGCDSESPSALVDGTQVFEGTVVFEGESQHAFSVMSGGGFRFELLELRVEPSTDDDPPFISIGFSFGRPLDDGTCDVSYSTTFSMGSSQSFGLTEREYCILMFDNGLIGEESSRVYSVSVAASK